MGNYVTQAAEVLRSWIRVQGKDPDESLTPELERLYVLLLLTRGEAVSLGEVHDAWAVARSIERPDHSDLVPFSELSAETQEYDRPFMQAIQAAACELWP